MEDIFLVFVNKLLIVSLDIGCCKVFFYWLVLLLLLLFNLVLLKILFRFEFFIMCSENSFSKYIWKVEGEDVLVNLMYVKKDKLLKF